MRILITNDDGIHAPGLEVLERIAHTLSDDVWVVAPENDQSGLSHSLSLNDPLRLREVNDRKFALRGTPSDCVIMAVRRLLGTRPDLVLSGGSHPAGSGGVLTPLYCANSGRALLYAVLAGAGIEWPDRCTGTWDHTWVPVVRSGLAVG